MSDDQGLPVIYDIFQDWNTLEDLTWLALARPWDTKLLIWDLEWWLDNHAPKV